MMLFILFRNDVSPRHLLKLKAGTMCEIEPDIEKRLNIYFLDIRITNV